VEAEGDVATAVTLARILSSIPLSRGGPTSVVIFDIHALQARGAPDPTRALARGAGRPVAGVQTNDCAHTHGAHTNRALAPGRPDPRGA